MTINTQKLREALELIEDELQASYNNAKPVCCGHGYGECCGNPEPEWDAGDQKIMDVLGPVQQALSDAVSQADAQAAEIARLRTVLAGLIAVCEPNIYPQPDKPNSAWAKLVAARAALQEKSHG